MNKKGMKTTIFGVIIGLIISVFFVIILLNLMKGFFFNQDRGEENLDTFYFSHLINDLKTLEVNSVKESSVSLTKNKIIIGFGGDIINQEDVKCTNFNLEKGIQNPVICRGKSCLCLCSLEDDDPLEVNCEGEGLICVQFNNNIKTDNSCNNFILYLKDDKVQNLALKKDIENIYIKLK